MPTEVSRAMIIFRLYSLICDLFETTSRAFICAVTSQIVCSANDWDVSLLFQASRHLRRNAKVVFVFINGFHFGKNLFVIKNKFLEVRDGNLCNNLY